MDDKQITEATGVDVSTVANVKPGDTVTVNGEQMEVIKVGNLTEAAAKVPTEPIVIDATPTPMSLEQKMEQAWHNLVTGVIRKSKGLGPDDKVEVPAGESGHYIKYALDNQGRFSMGKGHGRRRVRWTSWKADLTRLYNQLFSAGLAAAFQRAAAEATLASTEENKVEPTPITREKVQEIQAWATSKAEELMNAPAKAKAKAARKRQHLARKVGFGLVKGNQARGIFSAD